VIIYTGAKDAMKYTDFRGKIGVFSFTKEFLDDEIKNSIYKLK